MKTKKFNLSDINKLLKDFRIIDNGVHLTDFDSYVITWDNETRSFTIDGIIKNKVPHNIIRIDSVDDDDVVTFELDIVEVDIEE